METEKTYTYMPAPPCRRKATLTKIFLIAIVFFFFLLSFNVRFHFGYNFGTFVSAIEIYRRDITRGGYLLYNYRNDRIVIVIVK